MDSDRLDCEINRASAALPMEPALLTARTYSICFNVIVFTSYPFRRRWRSRAARRNAAVRQAFFPYFITLRGKKQSPQASRSFLRFAPTSHFPSAKPMSLNRLFVLQILRVQAYNEREKRVMPLKGGLHHG